MRGQRLNITSVCFVSRCLMLPQVWHSVDGELPRSSLELFPQIVMRECLCTTGHVDECLLKALAPTCRVLEMVSGCGDSGEHAATLSMLQMWSPQRRQHGDQESTLLSE